MKVLTIYLQKKHATPCVLLHHALLLAQPSLVSSSPLSRWQQSAASLEQIVLGKTSSSREWEQRRCSKPLRERGLYWSVLGTCCQGCSPRGLVVCWSIEQTKEKYMSWLLSYGTFHLINDQSPPRYTYGLLAKHPTVDNHSSFCYDGEETKKLDVVLGSTQSIP